MVPGGREYQLGSEPGESPFELAATRGAMGIGTSGYTGVPGWGRVAELLGRVELAWSLLFLVSAGGVSPAVVGH